jgi:CRISPR-associated protein, Csm2 family
MSGFDYTDTFYNSFNLEKSDNEMIKEVVSGLKSVDHFFEFSKTAERSKELTRYSFIIAGEMAKSGLKMNQLRKFYNYVKKMQYDVKDDLGGVRARFQFLLPKLAGASAKKEEVKPLYTIIAACIQKNNIATENDVLWFIEFFEAILNYFEVLSKEKLEKDK